MDKRLPVLIVINDGNNNASNIVTILPITSNMIRVYPLTHPDQDIKTKL